MANFPKTLTSDGLGPGNCDHLKAQLMSSGGPTVLRGDKCPHHQAGGVGGGQR